MRLYAPIDYFIMAGTDQPPRKPAFQFTLRSLFVLVAVVAILVWLPIGQTWWVRVAMLWPFWVFCGWIYWLRTQSDFD